MPIIVDATATVTAAGALALAAVVRAAARARVAAERAGAREAAEVAGDRDDFAARSAAGAVVVGVRHLREPDLERAVAVLTGP